MAFLAFPSPDNPWLIHESQLSAHAVHIVCFKVCVFMMLCKTRARPIFPWFMAGLFHVYTWYKSLFLSSFLVLLDLWVLTGSDLGPTRSDILSVSFISTEVGGVHFWSHRSYKHSGFYPCVAGWKDLPSLRTRLYLKKTVVRSPASLKSLSRTSQSP